MEYKTTAYRSGDRCLRDCTATDDHKTSIQHLIMQTKLACSGMVGTRAGMSQGMRGTPKVLVSLIYIYNMRFRSQKSTYREVRPIQSLH